ncbi:hypothetical protein POZ87_18270 [Cupriavidus taiwanensis]
MAKKHGNPSDSSGDNAWLPEAGLAIDLTRKWAKNVRARTHCKIFLFGSSIYKGGEQFDSAKSDLDIVCIFPEGTDAQGRVEIISALRPLKLALEVQIVPALQRLSCTEPGVSVVALTYSELCTNVHKSGARRFWDRNYFYDFSADRARLFEEAGTQYIAEEGRQAMEYVQKVRNRYLAITANNTGGLDPYAGSDPLPKALLRSAAQLNPDAQDGEWYDLMLGLELIQSRVREARSQGSWFQQLADVVSVRCGARGQERSVSAEQQLLLGEILLDEALTLPIEEAVTFQLSIGGISYATQNVRDIFNRLERFAPGVKLTGHRAGSVILQVAGPESTFDLLKELQEHGALHRLLRVDSVEVIAGAFEHESAAAPGASRKAVILSRIKAWQPSVAAGAYGIEQQFLSFLNEVISEEPRLRGAQIFRDVAVDAVPRFQLDFMISWQGQNGNSERMAIEVTTARGPAALFDTLTRFKVLGQVVILVLLGGETLLQQVAGDLKRYAEVNANVEVVAVPTPPRLSSRAERPSQ